MTLNGIPLLLSMVLKFFSEKEKKRERERKKERKKETPLNIKLFEKVKST